MHFARCVEITGNCDGNEFGWLFDDNYFDLLPGMTKNVRILGKQNHGTISVKSTLFEECTANQILQIGDCYEQNTVR